MKINTKLILPKDGILTCTMLTGLHQNNFSKCDLQIYFFNWL